MLGRVRYGTAVMERIVMSVHGGAVELSNGEAGRGDAGPGKVRQSWIVQFRQRVAGIGS